MKKINQFEKNNLKTLRVEMDLALASISKRFGITIETGNASFTANEVTFKVKCNTLGSDGDAITKEAEAFERQKNYIGLGHLSVNDKIQIQGSTYILKGYNTRARKAPIQFSKGNSNYKCSIQMLLQSNPS